MKRHGALAVITIAFVLATGLLAWGIDTDDIALPSGTQLVVKLTNTLSTKGSEEGDPWAGKVAEPIFAAGEEVVPVDSTVRGHVTFVKPAGRATGRGEMRLVAETISVTGRGNFTIVALLKKADDNTGTKVKDAEGTVEGPGKSDKSVAKEAGIGAAAGAAVGSLAHGGSGALYGAAIGAMAGVIHSVAKKHQGPLLPPGTELTFVLDRTFLSKHIVPPPRANPSSDSSSD
ncbi:MAG TPA: hypothetical protein VEN79_11985 [Terriglobia bacterium]|nr:hypothetical protein [Terriglobia bacterium]